MPEGKRFVYWSNEQIDELAKNIRQKLEEKLNTQETVYNFLHETVTYLNGNLNITTSPTAFEEDGGSLYVKPDKSFELYLSPNTSPIRDNFTIAHELGHLLLHVDKELKEAVTFNRFGSDRYEWQANRFAAAFLMPLDSFINICKKFNNDVYRIAAHFQVSIPAVEIRMKSLSLK